MIKDIALTIDDEARIVAHRIDCEAVLECRANNLPILTMIGIKNPMPPSIKRHECLYND